MIRVHCPKCPKTYQVDDDKVGSRVQCKACGTAFTVVMSAEQTGGGRPRKGRKGGSPRSSRQVPAKLGPYIIQRKLGAGAMGDVYLGHDPVLERDAAIKMLPMALARDQERLKRFAREAQLAARLHHTHAVTVYKFGVEEGHPFLAMELIDGKSLDKCVADNGPLEWREATRVICDAAQGLAAAHEIGLVHRDIKPANLMRTSKGVTKIIDFGLARATLSDVQLTQEGTLLGTPAYMAPEQWTSGEIDGRTDLYSLVCSYYFLLTGRVPFEGTSMPALGYQHRYEPFPDARQRRPDLPNGVCRILARGCEKEPADRYQSATELAVELESLLAAPDASRPHWGRCTELHVSPTKVSTAAADQPAARVKIPRPDVAGPVALRRRRALKRWLVGTAYAAALFVLVTVMGRTVTHSHTRTTDSRPIEQISTAGGVDDAGPAPRTTTPSWYV